jgi:hypothetical protein
VSLKLINSWRDAHPTTINAVAAGNDAAAPAPAAVPRSPSPDIAAADDASPDKEQPLVESIADIGRDKLPGGQGGQAVEDAKVLLRRAQGKGVNPGSFLGLMLSTRDSSTGKPFADDVVGVDREKGLACEAVLVLL